MTLIRGVKLAARPMAVNILTFFFCLSSMIATFVLSGGFEVIRIAMAIGLLSILSCAEQQSSYSRMLEHQQAQGAWTEQLQVTSTEHLKIVDDQLVPIVGASVLIGLAPGNPFPDNVVLTDASGQIDLPIGWKTELPVTVQAPGFITLTYPHFSPSERILKLHKKEIQTKIEIKGENTGFGRLIDNDGKVDFGLTMADFDRTQMLSFDLSNVMSSDMDSMTILGKNLEIPSNITLPDQKESYIFFTIELNKPEYRNFVRSTGDFHFSSIHGWFSLQKVINDVRSGKSFYDLINSFQFTSTGSRDISVSGDLAGQDINLGETALDKRFSVTAPEFPSTNMMMSFALQERNGRFSPIDLKKVGSGETVSLKTSSKLASVYSLSLLLNNSSPAPSHALSSQDLLSIKSNFFGLFNVLSQSITQDFSQLSYALQKAGSPSPAFLPLIPKPTVANDEIKLVAPELPANLHSIATLVVYADILPGTDDSVHAEVRTRLWELRTDGWVSSIPLPQIEFQKIPGHTYRWEAYFLAQDASEMNLAEGLDSNTITHVSRNSINVQ
jgi:hypothetical protein